MPLTIQKVATLSGVTLRTLRHYDNIGLLKPTSRSEAGYRLYSDEDLTRLQQILLFRELHFPLKDIAALMQHPDFDTRAALKTQAGHLMQLSERYAQLSALALKTLKHKEEETTMSNEEKFDGFDYDKMMAEQKAYEPEVRARWGDTDAYRISTKRAKGYRKEDWAAIQEEADQNLRELIACFRERVASSDARVQAVCDAARRHITQYFYPCSKEMFAGLGAMYVADERFTAYYDKHETGLAEYYNEAIQAYAAQP